MLFILTNTIYLLCPNSWLPVYTHPSHAQVKLVKADHTYRNKAPVDARMMLVNVKGEHHGSIMRSEVCIHEAVSFICNGLDGENVMVVSPKETRDI